MIEAIDWQEARHELCQHYVKGEDKTKPDLTTDLIRRLANAEQALSKKAKELGEKD
ncbi:hypothetical protein V5T82_14095 [Magnetovibrio sp. PR-2]|uniref:hypothetical protein n=1 Tax=Magnetovibrio sp. PR-2 TaxID=3120356 RepID=UPI002FCDE5DB